jgi:FkbM family methyltransferase
MDERTIIESHFSGCDGLGLGRFLELGANDGVQNSLTVGLVAAGWSGVQVEPEPAAFLRLAANRRDTPKIELVNAAIGAKGSVTRFWAQHGGNGEIGTLSQRHHDFFVSAGEAFHRPYFLHVLPVSQLLAAFGGPLGWNFLLIDVEGINTEVLRAFPLAEMVDTQMVCVECDSGPEAAMEILRWWYDVRQVGVNVIGARRT